MHNCTYRHVDCPWWVGGGWWVTKHKINSALSRKLAWSIPFPSFQQPISIPPHLNFFYFDIHWILMGFQLHRWDLFQRPDMRYRLRSMMTWPNRGEVGQCIMKNSYSVYFKGNIDNIMYNDRTGGRLVNVLWRIHILYISKEMHIMHNASNV